MEKHFVTYNQSLALKELGFDEPCMGKYDTKQGDEWFLNIYSGHLNIQFSDKSKACIAPLKSQVFEWARKEYGYWSYIKEATKGTCRFYVEKFDEKFFNSDIINSYKEAESACIDKLIEHIKNK